jgi:hypothetical protein
LNPDIEKLFRAKEQRRMRLAALPFHEKVRTFVLNKAKWSEFLAALDAPIHPLPQMQRLLDEPDFFDSTPVSPEPEEGR